MRRAVILATLALLLLAVAGVTAAQEGVFESAEPGVDVSETTAQENTAPEPASPEPTGSKRMSPETTTDEETAPTDEEPPEAEESGEPVGKDKGSDKAGGGEQPESADRAGGAGCRRKVIVCHKGEKTLTVGTPAEVAHLRRGDSRGACGGVVAEDEEDAGNPGGNGQGPPGGAGRPGGQGPRGHGRGQGPG